MISFFINLALFAIGVYVAVLIAAFALVFFVNLLPGVVAALCEFCMGAYAVVRAVVMLDGTALRVFRTLHFAFSVLVLLQDRLGNLAPAGYEAAGWLILIGLVLFWFTPWARELADSIRGRLRSRRAAGSPDECSVR